MESNNTWASFWVCELSIPIAQMREMTGSEEDCAAAVAVRAGNRARPRSNLKGDLGIA
jgi:hypothetical protein